MHVHTVCSCVRAYRPDKLVGAGWRASATKVLCRSLRAALRLERADTMRDRCAGVSLCSNVLNMDLQKGRCDMTR